MTAEKDPRIEVIAYELFTSVIIGGDAEDWNGPWWVLEKEETRLAAADVVRALDEWQEAKACTDDHEPTAATETPATIARTIVDDWIRNGSDREWWVPAARLLWEDGAITAEVRDEIIKIERGAV